jgi:hypothetical protein
MAAAAAAIASCVAASSGCVRCQVTQQRRVLCRFLLFPFVFSCQCVVCLCYCERGCGRAHALWLFVLMLYSSVVRKSVVIAPCSSSCEHSGDGCAQRVCAAQ